MPKIVYTTELLIRMKHAVMTAVCKEVAKRKKTNGLNKIWLKKFIDKWAERKYSDTESTFFKLDADVIIIQSQIPSSREIKG